MKIHPSDKRPCGLERGEVRRVPQDRGKFVVAYHVCCPRCGFVTLAVHGSKGLDLREGATPEDLTLSQPLRCVYCEVLIHIVGGELRLEEDARVRPIRYR